MQDLNMLTCITEMVGLTTDNEEETFMFVRVEDFYNHDDNWQWFGGVYKGFNIASPGTVRDDGTPVEKETSLAKEAGVRYTDENLCHIYWFPHLF